VPFEISGILIHIVSQLYMHKSRENSEKITAVRIMTDGLLSLSHGVSNLSYFSMKLNGVIEYSRMGLAMSTCSWTSIKIQANELNFQLVWSQPWQNVIHQAVERVMTNTVIRTRALAR